MDQVITAAAQAPMPPMEPTQLVPTSPTAVDREPTLWYDSKAIDSDNVRAVFERVLNHRYTGVVLYPDNMERLLPLLRERVNKIVRVEKTAEFEALAAHPLVDSSSSGGAGKVIILSSDEEILAKADASHLSTCLRVYVDDAASLHAAIERGQRHDFLVIHFRDPTNIPLELVIASLQPTSTILVKEIADPSNIEDAIVTFGVMEVGADGVMFSPRTHEQLDEFLAKLNPLLTPAIDLAPATVVRTAPVGMGYRSCIDVATLFTPREGILVGSTSQGGILLCPEVFHLPYMELRPFRVNAGAVHSYVYNMDNLTSYMTELRAGSPVMLVDHDGKVRKASVGRMKTEIRPLRIIEAEFSGGQRVNVIMQDDWHVRVYSDKGLPLNITEIKEGDRVLAHLASPGRHVGIKVDEHIVEV
ncbi:MAG: 3-dehydroquinate synthase II [Proteobacteria bacterium]|nr:3-dehydroquinate synthase II [Pseudomonadota bacterium]